MPGTPARQAMSNFTRRSRSRSRSRGRSPGRKTQASPSRKAKQSPSPARKPRSSSKSRSSSKTRSAATPSTPTRQSARLAEKQYEVEKKVEAPRKSSPPRSKARKEEGESLAAPIGALFAMLLLPVIIYTVSLLCTKESCKLKMPTFSKKLKDYFDYQASMIVVGWFFSQVFLAVLPVGPVVSGLPVRGSQKLKYRCNGFIGLVVTLVALAVAHVYFKVKFSVVRTLWLEMLAAASVFVFVLSLALYIKARKAKPSALAPDATGNILVDFCNGRELNPRFGTFDLKFFAIRFGCTSHMVVNICMLVEAYTSKSGLSNYPFLLVAGTQVLYCAALIMNEDAFTTTPEIVKGGCGFMFNFGLMVIWPFVLPVTSRFLLANPQTLPLWRLAGLLVLIVVGFTMLMVASLQYAKFTRNPYDPALSHLESMPTSIPGQRLLVSGLWGMCRNPHYFGELVMFFSWALACGFSAPLVYFQPVLMTLMLAGQVNKLDAESRKMYGSTWDRFSQRVKYRLIPFLY